MKKNTFKNLTKDKEQQKIYKDNLAFVKKLKIPTELEQLQCDKVLKPRLYSLDEVRKFLKEQREEIKKELIIKLKNL